MHSMIIYLLVAIFLIQSSHSKCKKKQNCTLPSCSVPTPPQGKDAWIFYPCTVERIDATHAQSTLPANPAPPGYYYGTHSYKPIGGYISVYDPSIQLTCTGDGRWSYTSDFGFSGFPYGPSGGVKSGSTTTFCCYNFSPYAGFAIQFEFEVRRYNRKHEERAYNFRVTFVDYKVCANCSMNSLPVKNSSSLLQLNGTQSFRNIDYSITSLRYTQLTHTGQPFTSLCDYVFLIYCQVLPSDQNCKFSFISSEGNIVFDNLLDQLYTSVFWNCGVQPDTEVIMNKTSEIVCICNS